MFLTILGHYALGLIKIVVGVSLFQIYCRFFLRKVCQLIIVSYVSESKKLPVPSRYFGLGACDIIMTSSESQKHVLMP